MSNTAAIFYKRDGYNTQGKRLLGRQSAGEGFLKALVEYGKAEHLYCYTDSRDEFSEYCQKIQPFLRRPREVKWAPTTNPPSLYQAGTLYLPDPNLPKFAWQRRFYNQQAYSLCGVTHTIASMGVMENIGNLLIAPLMPWDALVCTSQAVKTAVDGMLNNWAEYLAERIGSKL
jgi:hypothetical protein